MNPPNPHPLSLVTISYATSIYPDGSLIGVLPDVDAMWEVGARGMEHSAVTRPFQQDEEGAHADVCSIHPSIA
jgi:hypothetical protein